MYLTLLLGLLSFVLCFIFTPMCREIALRYNLVDKPDEARKFHAVAVPRVGGLAIVLAYAAALGLMLLIPVSNEQLHIQHHALLRVLLPPATLIFLLGLLDDLVTLSALQKLAGQIFACITAAVLGHLYAPESFVFGAPHSLLANPLVSIAICTAWLVLCTNAINLIDGMDGLASGIGLVGTIATLMVGLYTHNQGLVVATVPLAGALCAFLFYNFNPASIFLGDCGSLTIGFMLGAISLTWQHHGGGMTLGMLAPIMVLALPLLDVALAIGRRFLRSVPLFSPDRGHIHHMIQARGHKTKAAALIMYGACAVAAVFSVVASIFPRTFRISGYLLLTVLLISAVRYLDYVEFRALRRVFSSGRMRGQVRDEIYLRELEIAFGKVEDAEGCWELVQQTCGDLRFATVELYLHGLYFDAVLDDKASERDWWMTVPVGDRGYLRVSRSNLLHTDSRIMPSLDQLRRSLDKWEQHLSMGKELERGRELERSMAA
ncbi:MAG: MraY family glycosyltransferase [Janthinobacterium lividum]